MSMSLKKIQSVRHKKCPYVLWCYEFLFYNFPGCLLREKCVSYSDRIFITHLYWDSSILSGYGILFGWYFQIILLLFIAQNASQHYLWDCWLNNPRWSSVTEIHLSKSSTWKLKRYLLSTSTIVSFICSSNKGTIIYPNSCCDGLRIRIITTPFHVLGVIKGDLGSHLEEPILTARKRQFKPPGQHGTVG